ncbi:MAG: HAD-IA family hydrolase [Candidatus Komeilibacteria bacterium]|nr:HAD-IA family hydrolase [Candidatus Komeilibacteria bacterium]
MKENNIEEITQHKITEEDEDKDQNQEKNPVLILGHPRSGTNYLKSLVSIHPEVSSLTEPYSLHSTFFTEKDAEVWKKHDFDPEIFAKELRDFPSLQEMMKTLQNFLTPSKERVNLVKETTFLLKLEWAREYLEHVKIIFLIRSPFAVISSFQANNLYDKWGYEERFHTIQGQLDTNLEEYKDLSSAVNTDSEVSKLAFLWIVQNFEAMKNLDQFENVIVKYEQLLENTKVELERINDFMDLDFKEIQDQFIKESRTETLGNMYSTFNAKAGDKDKAGTYLTPAEISEIEKVLNAARKTAEDMGIDFDKYFSYSTPVETKNNPKIKDQGIRPEQKEFNADSCLDSKELILQDILRNPIEFDKIYFSRFPITNTQFCSFLNAEKIKNEEDLTYKYLNTFGERCRIQFNDGMYMVQQGYGQHPCVYVNWFGCKAFCDWLGVKLPTSETIAPVLDYITSKDQDLSEVNIGEKIGGIVSVLDMNYRNELLNFIGNTWKWTDAPDQEASANKYGGAFNSSKYAWNTLPKRHKRFGASNLGFQVNIPQITMDKLLIPDEKISHLKDLVGVLSQEDFAATENIFFDLDGTLHDFKATARIAMSEVYKEIKEKFSLQVDSLQKAYGDILAQAEKQAFQDGKTSFDYRTERFTALLKDFSIEDDKFVRELVEVYGNILEKNLTIDDTTVETLRYLSGKYKLFLLTEGPLDAQIRTIEKLGINDFFTKVYTSGQYGAIKETGDLFEVAQKDLQLQTDSIVIVGDTPSKDIRGANLTGIKSILMRIDNTIKDAK